MGVGMGMEMGMGMGMGIGVYTLKYYEKTVLDNAKQVCYTDYRNLKGENAILYAN